jgi:hypothetical protein
MKKLFNILIISVIYLVFCGKSCVNDSERTAWQENAVSAAQDSVRGEFESDYLSEEARVAAEMTAIHKLEDLADYLEIFTDVSMDSLFRRKAGEMIRGIFVSEDSRLSFGPMKKEKMKSVTLGEFIDKGFGKNILRTGLVFDSIRVQQPLQKSGGESYSGRLKAQQTVIGYPFTDSIISHSTPVTIEFISSRQLKIVGSDTLKVWTVKLGDLEPK